ncbi:MAG: sulfatase-like hydrolase/transferase [Planctomycetota bacterium]
MWQRFYLLLLITFVSIAFGAEPVKPNILFILSDDMGYADAGFQGAKDIKTPVLDALAKSGTILDAHYVQPVCSPTRSSLLTGRYVAHTGVYTIVRPNAKWGLPLEERTLAQALREAGYETALTGKWHLGEYKTAYQPTQRGFDHQYGLWFGMGDYYKHTRDNQVDWHRDDKPCDEVGYSTHLIAKEACKLVEQSKGDKPLFLYLPFQAVHGPMQVPESYLKQYGDLKEPRKTYAGMLSALDEAVGQVLAAFDKKGLRENTLIIFSSDNGGPSPGRVTHNTPLRAGKGTIFEGGVRTCAFATWPGKIPAGQTIKEPVHIIDWYPTLLKLAQASPEQKRTVDGRDIWPVLTQNAKSPHDAILLSGTNGTSAAIRMGEWKLLVGAADSGVGEEEEGPKKAKKKKAGEDGPQSVLLFNLEKDISEKTNVATENPEIVKKLRARLDELRKDAVEPGNKTLDEK